MKVTTLTRSQQDVVEALAALPDAYNVEIRTRELVLPNGVVIADVSINGGRSGTEEKCDHCRHIEFTDPRSATFQWHNGKFVQATVVAGIRRHGLTMAQALKILMKANKEKP